MSDDTPLSAEHASGSATPEAALACEIRRRRVAAGLSQNTLANVIGYSRQYVSRAERASAGLASGDLIAGIDGALHVGGALVELHASLREQRKGRRAPTRAVGTGIALPLPALRASTAVTPVSSATHRERHDISEEIALAAEDAARFVRRAGAGISAELVDQLHADVRQLASAYLRRPPFAMFGPGCGATHRDDLHHPARRLHRHHQPGSGTIPRKARDRTG